MFVWACLSAPPLPSTAEDSNDGPARSGQRMATAKSVLVIIESGAMDNKTKGYRTKLGSAQSLAFWGEVVLE
jgi:hypothetical protein